MKMNEVLKVYKETGKIEEKLNHDQWYELIRLATLTPELSKGALQNIFYQWEKEIRDEFATNEDFCLLNKSEQKVIAYQTAFHEISEGMLIKEGLDGMWYAKTKRKIEALDRNYPGYIDAYVKIVAGEEDNPVTAMLKTGALNPIEKIRKLAKEVEELEEEVEHKRRKNGEHYVANLCSIRDDFAKRTDPKLIPSISVEWGYDYSKFGKITLTVGEDPVVEVCKKQVRADQIGEFLSQLPSADELRAQFEKSLEKAIKSKEAELQRKKEQLIRLK